MRGADLTTANTGKHGKRFIPARPRPTLGNFSIRPARVAVPWNEPLRPRVPGRSRRSIHLAAVRRPDVPSRPRGATCQFCGCFCCHLGSLHTVWCTGTRLIGLSQECSAERPRVVRPSFGCFRTRRRHSPCAALEARAVVRRIAAEHPAPLTRFHVVLHPCAAPRALFALDALRRRPSFCRFVACPVVRCVAAELPAQPAGSVPASRSANLHIRLAHDGTRLRTLARIPFRVRGDCSAFCTSTALCLHSRQHRPLPCGQWHLCLLWIAELESRARVRYVLFGPVVAV